jgi:ATP-dependent DNA helicase RecQ
LVGVGEAALVDRAPSDFGLGVEKRDVRFVIHWAPPASLEQYARELALIGRDGEESMAVLFHDPGERGRHESQLAGSRPSARHLLQLAKALEPSTIDGRARTLEALALSSGSSGRITESMAALLEDVGLAALASGWIRALVPARALMAGAERLAHRLDRLRARDVHRLDAVESYASTRGCLRQRLEELLGEHAGEPCGRCGTCRGSVLPGFDVQLPARGITRRPPVETFTIRRDGKGFGLAVTAPARQARPLTVKLADFSRR